MSFSSEWKEAIMHTEYKNSCCRRALLSAILVAKGEYTDREVTVSIAPELASFVSGAIVDCYGDMPTVVPAPKGGRCRHIKFHSKSAASYLAAVTSPNAGIGDMFFPRCATCRSAFVRGFFLACGRISEPQKSYCLELSPVIRETPAMEFLASFDLPFRTVVRRTEKIYYLKKVSAIEDFFALAEMPLAAFEITNAMIASDFRNNANRAANCETRNIGVSVANSLKAVVLLERLRALDLLEYLPEEVLPTARLRLEQPSLTLAQLASQSNPPLTKSGMAHRMKKIVTMGQELLAKYDSSDAEKGSNDG